MPATRRAQSSADKGDGVPTPASKSGKETAWKRASKAKAYFLGMETWKQAVVVVLMPFALSWLYKRILTIM